VAARKKFNDEEREAIHALLISWKEKPVSARRWSWQRTYRKRFSVEKVARVFRTTSKVIRDIERDFKRPFYTTDEIAASVLLWSRKNKRWPVGEDWKEFSFSRSTFERRFGIERPSWDPGSNMAAFQQYLLRTNTREWVQKNLTPQLVLDISNLTVRRTAFNMYGMERVIRGGGGTKVQEDEYGTLWSLPPDNQRDHRVVYVEVENKTANPDGSFDHYFLRVPPLTRTAREAVAWTFHQGPGVPAVPLFTAES